MKEKIKSLICGILMLAGLPLLCIQCARDLPNIIKNSLAFFLWIAVSWSLYTVLILIAQHIQKKTDWIKDSFGATAAIIIISLYGSIYIIRWAFYIFRL